MNVGASHDGEDCDRASMPESFTMESPTRENTMPDRSLRTISDGDRHAGESHVGGYHPGKIFLESAMVQKPLPEIPAMEKTSLESCTLH